MSLNSSISGSVAGTESPIQAASSEVSSDTPVVVLIVGSGLSGLATALSLTALGCDVHIYDENTVPNASSEAVVPLTDELQAFLSAHEVDVENGRARAAGRQVLADDGEVAVQDDKQQDYVSWDSLRGAMLQRIPPGHLHTGCPVTAVDLSGPSTAAICTEAGERIEGQLVLAADGINSLLRRQLLPQCQPTYAGYLAWRGIVRVDDLSGEVQQLLADKSTMYKGPYLHFQVQPLASSSADHSKQGGSSSSSSSSSNGSRRLAWTWFNNQMEDELPGLLLDQQLEVHAHTVPLGALNPAVADAVASAAAGSLPPPLAELVSCSVTRMGVTAVSDMVLSGCVISNKLAFIGKAGSVVRPHCCSSAQKAALDATSLADCLRANKLVLEKALPKWEQQQVQRNLALCQEAVIAGERMQGFSGR